MKIFFLISFLAANFSLASNHCEDPFNPRSPIALNPIEKKTAECRYLFCDLSSQQGLIGQAEASLCSTSYELILKKIHQSDFTKFMIWWKESKGQENFLRLCKDVDLDESTWKFYSLSDSCL
jgi:hypothetical protein